MNVSFRDQLRAVFRVDSPLDTAMRSSLASLASDPVLACAHGRVAHDHHEDDPVVEDLERRVAAAGL